MTQTDTHPDDFELLFGEPALLKGESRNSYELLRTLVTDQLQAKDDIFSQLKVQEITDSIWEGRRFKRFGAQSVERAMQKGLEYLLQNALVGGGRRAAVLTSNYYFGSAKDKEEAKKIVAALGITPDKILGQAVAMSGEYGFFERLADNRATARRQLLKDHERQLRRAEKQAAALARQRGSAGSNDNSAAPKKDVA